MESTPEVIKEIYFWSKVHEVAPHWVKRLNGIDVSRPDKLFPLRPEHRDRVWAVDAKFLLGLLRAGRVRLQQTRVDFNNDGKTEIVYRMTWVGRRYDPGMRARKGIVEVGDCPDPLHGNERQVYTHYVLPSEDLTLSKNLALLGNHTMDFFWYRNRAYHASTGRVSYSVPSTFHGALNRYRSLCVFRFRRVSP